MRLTLIIIMLALELNGCAVGPTKSREGDFVLNMAEGPAVNRAAPGGTSAEATPLPRPAAGG